MPFPPGTEPPRRIRIEDVRPQVDCGGHPAKACVGDRVQVTARVFRDGHEVLGAAVRVKAPGARRWSEAPLEAQGNDWWSGSFAVDRPGRWRYQVTGWVDRHNTTAAITPTASSREGDARPRKTSRSRIIPLTPRNGGPSALIGFSFTGPTK
jgi:hypothetical protein